MPSFEATSVRGLPRRRRAGFVFPAVRRAGQKALGPSGRPASISLVAVSQVTGRQARPRGEAQKGLGGQAEPEVVLEATEQRDAPVGALELKVLHDAPSIINVRAAGDRDCSVDLSRRRPEKRGNDLAHERRPGLARLQVEGA